LFVAVDCRHVTISPADQVNHLLVFLERSVEIIFLVDLVLVFIGLLIILKGSCDWQELPGTPLTRCGDACGP
jgi:hypothetical protein